MPIYVALFRGINVGGNSMLPMAELITLLQDLGCTNVKTYIQSGNAVFAHPTSDPIKLAEQVSHAVKTLRGFEPNVLLVTSDELEKAIDANPFTKATANPSRLHLGFLASKPKNPNLQAIEKLRIPSESYQLIDEIYYLYAPDGVGGSKLAAGAERLLDVPMTFRNWNTVLKLAEMARELSNSG